MRNFDDKKRTLEHVKDFLKNIGTTYLTSFVLLK